MPQGPQSLVPLVLSSYSTQSASAYKCTIDANESIVSQPVGSLCVYPTAPASLAVLVDVGFSLLVPGASPWALQQAAAPLQVNLVAPGTNSYYACIYFDQVTNTCGVVYGTSAVSPAPILPNFLHQIPLALVLLSAGQISVTSGITDIRSWVNRKNSLQIASGTFTVQAFGHTFLEIQATPNASSTLSIANLAYGTDVRINLTSTASATPVFINCTTPDGVVISTFYCSRVGASASKLVWNATNSHSFNASSVYALDAFWFEVPGTGSPFLLFS